MSDEKQDFYYLRLSKEDGDIEAMIFLSFEKIQSFTTSQSSNLRKHETICIRIIPKNVQFISGSF